MKEKIILSRKNVASNEGFSLKLDGLDEVCDLHLSPEEYEKEFFKAIDENDFYKCEQFITLLGRVSKGKYKKLNELKIRLIVEKILYKFNKEIKSFYDYVDMYKEFNNLSCFKNEINSSTFHEDIKKKVAKVKCIENEINLKEIIDKTINDIYKIEVNLKGLKRVEEFCNGDFLQNNRIGEKLKVKYLSKLNDEYNKVVLNEEKIKTFIGCEGNEDFFNSKELLSFVERSIKEKMDFLEFIAQLEKVEMLYKFNNLSNIEEKILSLYSVGNIEFVELPMVYKRNIVKSILNKSKNNIDYKEFENLFQKELNNIININKEKAIPLI